MDKKIFVDFYNFKTIVCIEHSILYCGAFCPIFFLLVPKFTFLVQIIKFGLKTLILVQIESVLSLYRLFLVLF